MIKNIYYLLGIAAAPVSLVLIHFFKVLFFRLGVVDVPGEGKVHNKPKVTMLGVPMFIAFSIIYAIYLIISSTENFNYNALYYYIGALACFALGVADDFYRIKALFKVIPLLLISIYLSYFILRINIINIPLVGQLELPELVAIIISSAWFFVVISAVNIIDGIDGLLGSFAVSFFSACLIIGLMRDYDITIFYSLVSFGIVAVYMLYNFPPAEVFMGNSGSHLIAFFVATIPFIERGQNNSLINVAPYIVMLAYPLFDITISLMRRFLGRVSVFSRDIDHVHHLLLRRFGDERKTLKFFIGLFSTNAVMSITLLMMNHAMRVFSFFIYIVINILFSLCFALRHKTTRNSAQ